MNKIYLNIGFCSSWGVKLDKHIFKTQYAPRSGHIYCLNCGLTKKEARSFDGVDSIETRIFDYHSDLSDPKFL